MNTNDTKRVRNHAFKTEMRTNIKYVENFIAANDVDNAKAAFHKAVSKIDRAVSKGAIHKNNGNRHKARLAEKLNDLSA